MLIPKTYPALSDAIEEGLRIGYRRAFKHNETPSEEAVLDSIHENIMVAILERFDIKEYEMGRLTGFSD